MKFASFLFMILFFLLIGCSSIQDHNYNDLNTIRKNFIEAILENGLEESPFHMNYQLRTILFSDKVISLLGEIIVYDHLPHGWSKYEGKTFIKVDDSFQEITLSYLFSSPIQKEFLRNYCENYLKNTCDQPNYFNGKDPLLHTLDLHDINLFVIDHESLMIIFQPYSVGGQSDGPLLVKIPFTELAGKWQKGNPLERQLPIVHHFVSSWDSNNWVIDVSEDD